MGKEKRLLKSFLASLKSSLIGENNSNIEDGIEVKDVSLVNPPVVCEEVPERVALYGIDGTNILPGEERILIEDGVKKRYYCDRFVEGNGYRMYYIADCPSSHSKTYVNFNQPIGFMEPPADSYQYFREKFINDTTESDEPVMKQIVGIAIKRNEVGRNDSNFEKNTYLVLNHRQRPTYFYSDGKKIVPKGSLINYGTNERGRILRGFDSPEELLDCLEKDYGELFDIKPKRGR